MLANVFAAALSVLPVHTIGEPWRIRWELLYAAAGGHWNRVGELARRWVAVAPTDQALANGALARVLFLSVQRLDSPLLPDWWLPYEGAGDTVLGTYLAGIRALQVGEASSALTGTWDWPSSLTDTEFTRVLDATNALAHVERNGQLPLELESVRAWCDAVSGIRRSNRHEIRQAADRYQRIATNTALQKGVAQIPLSSASLLYRMAGDLEQARQTAVLLTEQAPDSAEAWRLRAQLERQLALGVDVVADSYEHFVRLAPEGGDGWERTELLQLLLESKDNETARRAISELALTHSERAVALELIEWDWPAFATFSDSTKERWWQAHILVCDPRIRAAFHGTPWRIAAADFGEAVAAELKVRIFGPFSEWDGFKRAHLSGKDNDIATAITRSRATFGTMVAVLKATGDSRQPLGQLLATFLYKFHPALREHIKNPTALNRLEQAVVARNDAAHGNVSPGQTRQIFRDAKTFLEILARADARTASGRD